MSILTASSQQSEFANIDKQLLKVFAYPSDPFQVELVDTLSVEYARLLCVKFLDRFSRDLDLYHPGITSLIEEWHSSPITFVDTWHPVFEEIRSTLLPNDEAVDYILPAIKLALHIQYCGGSGEWEACLNHPIQLLWGEWLLPIADRLSVTSSKDDVLFKVHHQGMIKQLTYHRNDNFLEGNISVDKLSRVLNTHISLIPSNILDVYSIFGCMPLELGEFHIYQVEPNLQSALNIIQSHAGVYSHWVHHVVRAIIPIKQLKENTLGSASCRMQPGRVCISLTPSCSPMSACEMIIHESAHQYYRLLSRAGAFDDGTDKKLYYSPLKQTERPIERLLLAYHAYANILLFYHLCATANFPGSEHAKKSIDRMYPKLLDMEVFLAKNSSLTSLGNAIWRPLAEKVQNVFS